MTSQQTLNPWPPSSLCMVMTSSWLTCCLECWQKHTGQTGKHSTPAFHMCTFVPTATSTHMSVACAVYCVACCRSFGFGETQFQVFILMASRRLAADRFYTSDYNAATYTQVGLDWIEGATFRSVLLRNVPELRASGVQIPPNAFNPWTLPA